MGRRAIFAATLYAAPDDVRVSVHTFRHDTGEEYPIFDVDAGEAQPVHVHADYALIRRIHEETGRWLASEDGRRLAAAERPEPAGMVLDSDGIPIVPAAIAADLG
jgi:hypothetical protein